MCALAHQDRTAVRQICRRMWDGVFVGYRLADRLGVGGVILLSADIGLYIARRHQPHVVTKRADLPRPEVRRRACFHAHQARWQTFEELQHLGAAKLLPDGGCAPCVNAVNLEHRLGKIDPNCDNLDGGRLRLWRLLQQRPPYGASTPDTGAVHPIRLTLTNLCKGRGYWLAGDPNDANLVQEARLPVGRDSACGLALLLTLSLRDVEEMLACHGIC